MKLQPVDDTNYNTVCEWWIARGMTPVPRQSLPLTGYIVSDDKYQYCAGFLYKTDSDLALVDGFISNKDSDYEKRAKALDMLLTALMDEAKRDNYRVIIAQSTHSNSIKIVERFNFTKMTQESVTYFKEVT